MIFSTRKFSYFKKRLNIQLIILQNNLVRRLFFLDRQDISLTASLKALLAYLSNLLFMIIKL